MSSVTLSSDKKNPVSTESNGGIPQPQQPQNAPTKSGLGLSRIWDSYGMLVSSPCLYWLRDFCA